ncbi:MAG: hypothetical protein JNL94_13485 [Planctomycetes bacterium]|nr:hypothetical protein [Planctomycetota bacterium]
MKAARKTTSKPRIDPRILRDRLTPIAKVVAGVLVLVVFGLVGERVADAARKDPRFIVDPTLLVHGQLPHWMPNEVVTNVREHLRSVRPRSIFAERFEDDLRAELRAASWWIEDVRTVERLFPNRVRIDMIMRKPIATIDRGDTCLLVDGQGRVLYAEPRSRPTAFGFTPRLQIRGAAEDKFVELGEIAGDPQIVAGARVAAEVLDVCSSERRILPRVQIQAIDVAHPTTGLGAIPGVVHLVTDRNVLIRWGRARSDPSGSTEQPVERKVKALERVEARFPGLSGLDEVRVDLEGDPMYKAGGGTWIRCEEYKDEAAAPGKP